MLPLVNVFAQRSYRRKHAIKQLLAQSAPALDDFKVVGLIGSLRIPTEWVDEAKATLALYHGDIYLAYQLYSSARSHRTAHELALNYLAPEAVLKEDLQMLSDLFSDLDASLIEDFAVGGQVKAFSECYSDTERELIKIFHSCFTALH